MNEMTMVERAFAEPDAEPDAFTAGRERLLREVRAEAAPRRRARRPLWAGVAVLAAGAVAAAAVVVAGDPDPVRRTSPASDVLLVAATRSAAATETSGKYWWVRREERNTFRFGKERPYEMAFRRVQDTWWAGAVEWQGYRTLAARPVKARDARAWRADGSPLFWDLGPCSRPDGQGGRVSVDGPCGEFDGRARVGRPERVPDGMNTGGSGLDARTLSDDPVKLRAQILKWARDGGTGGPVEGDAARLWLGVHYLLFDPRRPVNGRLRAAAYRMLADVPEVRSLGTVTDAAGRQGTALALDLPPATSDGSTGRIIIDPGTGAPLASENRLNGELVTYDLILEARYTDTEPGS